jgi:hypothetical protein
MWFCKVVLSHRRNMGSHLDKTNVYDAQVSRYDIVPRNLSNME